jgi:tRNA pseudouridine55 synthase
MASGLLVICLGEATKLVPYLMNTGKRYLGIATLGQSTDSDDAQGQVIESRPVPPLDHFALFRLLPKYRGEISQVPPIYAAIKQDGEALYRKARRGELVEVAPRTVEIHALALKLESQNEVAIDVRCGKGFYVRALARDIARDLGTVGHLSMLRRLETSGYALEQACDFDLLQRAAAGKAVLPVHSVDTALRHLRPLRLDPQEQDHIRHGRPCVLTLDPPLLPHAKLALCNSDGSLIAVGRAIDETTVTSERWLHL